MADLFDSYPYRDRFPVLHDLPEQGRPRGEVLAELSALGGRDLLEGHEVHSLIVY